MNEQVERYRRILRNHLPLLDERYRVASLCLFGSRLRGEAREGSDLDVLVTFHEIPSLLRLVELENFLSDLLSVRVDLVLRESLKPQIGRQILSEATPV